MFVLGKFECIEVNTLEKGVESKVGVVLKRVLDEVDDGDWEVWGMDWITGCEPVNGSKTQLAGFLLVEVSFWVEDTELDTVVRHRFEMSWKDNWVLNRCNNL